MTVLVNRAKMTTATTGTGTITLGAAVAGYQTFADAGVTNGQVVRYVIEDGINWEIGTGTYTSSGTTLSRTVNESSNADAAISLSGLAQVYITAAAADILQPDNNLSDLANAATARTNLGLGTIATQAANNVSITGGSITGITDLAVSDGGTGASSFTANNVLLGNGTSAFQVVAPGTNGNVLTSNGTTWTSAAPSGSAPSFQEFTSSGTWTKPTGATFVMVEALGAGGGGGSGRRGATSTLRSGGGAGGGGAYTYRLFKAADLGSTVTVTIGAGGTGGAARTTDSTDGLGGANGGDTSFGTHLVAYGGQGGGAGTTSTASGGRGAGVLSTGSNSGHPILSSSASNVTIAGQFGGGTGFVGTNPVTQKASGFGGGGGGGTSLVSTEAGGCSYQGGAGGGPGGSISSANSNIAAGAGGSITGANGGGGTAGSLSAGGNGAFRQGGGGGAVEFAGGNGGIAGGGGGGGGSTNGTNSGAGGNGGAGLVRVYTW